MKVSLKSYYKPTPKKMRQIGDTLLLFSLCISTYFIENPKAMLISSISGAVGKFITNFFTENEPIN